jgi:hypothetical protein
MSGRDFRTVNMIEGQKIESDKVIKRIGDISYRDIGSIARAGLIDSGKAAITSGLRVVTGGNMVVSIPTGNMLQRITSGDVLPIRNTEDQTITMSAASGVPRIDIIECQVKSVTDKNDVAQAVLDSSTGIISLETIKRDIKYYLSVQKKTGSTTATPATAGILTGTVGIPATIDLSAKYLLNLSDGEDGSFQEIDLRGSTPEATTLAEIIANINSAVGRTMASVGAGDTAVLTSIGTGITSYFEIKPPVTNSDADALQVVFGLSASGVYNYIYHGVNDWIKLAEIDIDAATTVITSSMIRNIDQKSTWASDDTNISISPPALQPLSERDAHPSLAYTDLFPIETAEGLSRYATWDLVRTAMFIKKIYTNILGKRNAGSPNTQIDYSFDELWVEGVKLTSKSYTLNQAASGALGIDTGAVAQSSWYYVHVLTNNDGSIDTAVLSLSSTTPTLPVGYTKSQLISMAYTAITTKYFVDFVQQDSKWHYVSATVMKTGAAFYNETLNCSQWIPEKVKESFIKLRCQANDNADGVYVLTTIDSYANGVYVPYLTGEVILPAGMGVASAISTLYGVIGSASRSIKYSTIDQISAATKTTTLSIVYNILDI